MKTRSVHAPGLAEPLDLDELVSIALEHRLEQPADLLRDGFLTDGRHEMRHLKKRKSGRTAAHFRTPANPGRENVGG